MLGQGGIGEVVLVEDQDIARKVAIKRLHPERRDDAESLRRFAEEVRIIGQLEHPNITPVHDVGVDEEGRHYFVMKYIEGETLETIIARLRARDADYVRRFGYDVRVEIFIGMLNAVAYAHARGILHRDLKPANIMVGPYGEVTVMDWGIAKRLAGAAEPERGDPRCDTVDGAILGTPMYMSPEQAAGEHGALDQRSDVFSLCLVFYELMTLQHPLAQHKTVQRVIAELVAHGIDRSIKIDFIRAGAPAEYGDLVQRGLARDRERRFGSVKALLDELLRVRSGKFPITCHVTLGRRTAAFSMGWITRHPLGYTLLLAGSAAFLVWQAVRLFIR
jgi:serine/threonine-protein kinase